MQCRLTDLLSSGDQLVLDAAKVHCIDAAALQLLTAFVQETKAQHLDFSWRHPSTELRDAASVIGIEQHRYAATKHQTIGCA